MDFWLLAGKGAVIGLSIAAPVGPVGLLCIRRSVRWGASYGFTSGLGAAAADAVYGLIAAGGFSVVARHLVDQQAWFALVGGGLMAYLGWGMVRRHAAGLSRNESGNGNLGEEKPTWRRAFLTTFAITLANPITLVAFLALMAGFNLVQGGWEAGAVFVGGVFTGSALWWLLLSQMASRLRRVLEGAGLRWLDWICGGVLLAFAAWSLVRAGQAFWAG